MSSRSQISFKVAFKFVSYCFSYIEFDDKPNVFFFFFFFFLYFKALIHVDVHIITAFVNDLSIINED